MMKRHTLLIPLILGILGTLPACGGGDTSGEGGSGEGGSGEGGSGGGPELALSFDAPKTSDAPVFTDKLVGADFNSDGKLDLVVGSEGGGIGLLYGNGDGTFTAEAAQMSSTVLALCAADLDGDGHQDVAVAVAGAVKSEVDLLRGAGDGTFSAAGAIEFRANAIAARDVSGDGKTDLVLVGEGSGNLPGKLVVSIQGAPTALTFDVPQPFAVDLGDLDGDGDLDIVVATGAQITRGLAVFLGHGDGTFEAGQTIALGQGEMKAIALADLDGDGAPDIVTTGSHGAASVLLGHGDGTFGDAFEYATHADGVMNAVAAVDLNGGGRIDLATVAIPGAGPAALDVHLGRGDGTFAPAVQELDIDTSDVSAGSIVVADADGDGKPDLIVSGGQKVTALLNRSH